MEREDHDLLGRRSLLKKVSATAVAGLAVGATSAYAQTSPPPADFEPARHDLDSWLGEMKGSHRVFIDSSTAGGGANASPGFCSASSRVIAALSVKTSPSPVTRVGIWPNGLTASRSARIVSPANKSPTSSRTKSSPYQTSCASTITEPHPGRAYSLYKIFPCMGSDIRQIPGPRRAR